MANLQIMGAADPETTGQSHLFESRPDVIRPYWLERMKANAAKSVPSTGLVAQNALHHADHARQAQRPVAHDQGVTDLAFVTDRRVRVVRSLQ